MDDINNKSVNNSSNMKVKSVYIRKKKKKKTKLNEYYVDVVYKNNKRINRKLGIFANKTDNRKTIKDLEKLRREIMERLNNGETLDSVLSVPTKNIYRDYKVIPYIKKLSKRISLKKIEKILSTIKAFSGSYCKNSVDFKFENIDRLFIIEYFNYIKRYFDNQEADLLIKNFINILNYAVREGLAEYSHDWDLTTID